MINSWVFSVCGRKNLSNYQDLHQDPILSKNFFSPELLWSFAVCCHCSVREQNWEWKLKIFPNPIVNCRHKVFAQRTVCYAWMTSVHATRRGFPNLCEWAGNFFILPGNLFTFGSRSKLQVIYNYEWPLCVLRFNKMTSTGSSGKDNTW